MMDGGPLSGTTWGTIQILIQFVANPNWTLIWYHLGHDPNLDSIRGEPEFQRLFTELQNDLAAQALRVQDLKASGELSSIALLEK